MNTFANATLTSAKPQPVFSSKRAPAEWRSLPTRYAVVDLETHGLEARFDLSKRVYCGCVVVVDGDSKPKLRAFYTWEEVVDLLQPLLDDGFAFVCHNAKFDVPVLTARGLRISYSQVYCTQVLSYLLRNDLPSFSLDALVPGAKVDVVQELIDDGIIDKQDKRTFWETDWGSVVPVTEAMLSYCVEDTKACHKLYKRLLKDCSEQLCISYHRTEQPMLRVLVSLERNGMPIDKPLLISSIERYRKEVEEHKRTIEERFGLLPQLEWNDETGEYEPKEKVYKSGYYRNASTLCMDYYSPNAVSIRDWGGYTPDGSFVQHLDTGEPLTVYNHCKLVPYNAAAATGHTWWIIKNNCPQALEFISKTKAGKPQVNKDFISDVAEHLPEDFPIAKLAKATKRLQALEGMWQHLREDSRIAPDFNHTLTLTGRLSCSRPNLQNVERAGDDEESQVFRKLVAAPEGKRIAVADLDAIELRVLAYYILKVTKDSSMADVLNSDNPDLHTANATKWGVKRNVAKTLVFLLIYGGQPALMVKRKLFQTLAEAEAAFESVHTSQPTIKQLMKLVIDSVEDKGYVTTLGGRRLHYPAINSRNKYDRLRAERQCFNALIQGGARDIMHQLVIETQEVLDCYGVQVARMINIVHDELVVECSEWCADALVEDLNSVWQARLDLLPGVRVNGDWHHGQTWYEAK